MKFTLLALIFAAAGAHAVPAPAPTCDLLRQAQATIVVYKYTFTQKNGVWVQNPGEEVGRTTTLAPVIGQNNNGCKLDSVRIDNVPVNGQPESISVQAYIHILNSPSYTSKNFSGSYWLSSQNGRQGWVAAETKDLNTEKLGVQMNLESAATTPTAHSDVISVTISFDDNAQ